MDSNSGTDRITIRAMSINDLPELMDLKASVGWNQTEWDWKQFLNREEYCFVAADDGKVVGSITAYSYEGKVAWIGMVIVDKNHRGKGVSKQLLDHLIGILKNDHPSIKLDATPAGVPVYKKFGFREEGTFDRMICKQIKSRNSVKAFDSIDNHLKGIEEYDKETLGYSRMSLLKAMNKEYPSYGVCQLNEKGKGYLLGRNGSNYTQLGPLIANSDELAIELLNKNIRKNHLGSALIDVSHKQQKFIKYLEQVGFKKERSFTRMYLGTQTKTREDLQYLIIGPEFG